ncbi:hypothetical protein [Methylobacterium sp. WL120]|uniref:hypothetical protein n=1 Tax=Methylobacterium sp. WL120 TaxID=2603887 RepID=UPI0011CA862A|nr:hypothetical protein [Methylobacterium sp. WL120]TXM69628.1 hypothetical protein FV229_04605 [Methylobacterium sp. WL120]
MNVADFMTRPALTATPATRADAEAALRAAIMGDATNETPDATASEGVSYDPAPGQVTIGTAFPDPQEIDAIIQKAIESVAAGGLKPTDPEFGPLLDKAVAEALGPDSPIQFRFVGAEKIEEGVNYGHDVFPDFAPKGSDDGKSFSFPPEFMNEIFGTKPTNFFDAVIAPMVKELQASMALPPKMQREPHVFRDIHSATLPPYLSGKSANLLGFDQQEDQDEKDFEDDRRNLLDQLAESHATLVDAHLDLVRLATDVYGN